MPADGTTSESQRSLMSAPAWVGYTLVVVSTLAFSAVLWLVDDFIPLGRHPFAYILLVSLAAYAFGFWPAVVAFLLSLVAFLYLFIGLPLTFWPLAWTADDWAALVAMISGAVIGGVGGLAIRHNHRRVGNLAQQLQQSNQRSAAILDSITDGFFSLDREWNFNYVNPVAERLLRKGRDELLGRDIWDVFSPAAGTIFQEQYDRAILDQQPVTFEGYYQPLETWFEVHAYPSPIGLTVYFQDITPRRKIEEALRDSEERFRLIAETATDAIVTIDADSIILYANPAAEPIFGYESGELQGMNLTSLMPEKLRKPHLDGMIRYIRTGERRVPWRGVRFPGLHKSGREVPLEVSYSDFDTTTGRVFVGIVRDITARVRAEEALRRSEANLRAMIDAAPAAVFTYNREGIIQQANPACEEIYGFRPDQLVGRSLFETVADEDTSEETLEVIRRVFAGEIVRDKEWEDRRMDGTSVWVLTSTTPIHDAQGQVILGMSLNMDITGRKRTQEQEQELERTKQEFYRRTILAATDGKLVILDRSELQAMLGEPIRTWPIEQARDVGRVRADVLKLAQELGMPSDRVDDFVHCLGEAATNACKHAKNGVVSLRWLEGDLLTVVQDEGSGIEAVALPELALKHGYTTAVSLGMGYKVMISLADKVYLATQSDGTIVALRKALRAPEGAELMESILQQWPDL